MTTVVAASKQVEKLLNEAGDRLADAITNSKLHVSTEEFQQVENEISQLIQDCAFLLSAQLKANGGSIAIGDIKNITGILQTMVLLALVADRKIKESN